MRVFVDESGQTGSVSMSRKKNALNFSNHPLFVNGSVVVRNAGDQALLENKYREFKARHENLLNQDGELKGNDLTTRKTNDALLDFVSSILDARHFYINVYDKKFYLSTLLLNQLLPIDRWPSLDLFYIQAAFLSKQEDDFFLGYCRFVEHANEGEEEFCELLLGYDYQFELDYNFCKEFVAESVRNECPVFSGHLLLGHGAYESDPSIVNLINLNSLSELILFIKEHEKMENAELCIVHDKIERIEDVMMRELSHFGLRISFEESANSLLLQLADNVASLFSHFMLKSMNHLKDGKAWRDCSEWDLSIQSKLFQKVGWSNIKTTVSVDDMAAYHALSDIFSEGAPAGGAFDKQCRLNCGAEFYCRQELKRLRLIAFDFDRQIDALKK